jgi:hypothetical protein
LLLGISALLDFLQTAEGHTHPSQLLLSDDLPLGTESQWMHAGCWLLAGWLAVAGWQWLAGSGWLFGLLPPD